eukprot:g2065.t1
MAFPWLQHDRAPPTRGKKRATALIGSAHAGLDTAAALRFDSIVPLPPPRPESTSITPILSPSPDAAPQVSTRVQNALLPLKNGLYPVMLTPFTADGSAVDYRALEILARWYLDNGAAGLFPVAQSSEMYNLSPEERLECARVVRAAAEGRGPVCAAGTFDGTVEEQAAFVNRMAEHADVVVVLVCMMAKQDEGDDVWRANMGRLLELTGDVPLGLYECPAPYHRLLTPATLRWLADTGRFFFHKDTSRRNDLISAKLAALQGRGPANPFRWYNGNCTTLLHSLRCEHSAQCNGFGGVSANFYPWFFPWIVEHAAAEPEKAARLQTFLTVAEGIVKQMYPASAKVFLARHCDFAITAYCRNGSSFNTHPENLEKLDCLHTMATRMAEELGIVPVPPAPNATCAAAAAAVGAAEARLGAGADGADSKKRVANALEFD